MLLRRSRRWYEPATPSRKEPHGQRTHPRAAPAARRRRRVRGDPGALEDALDRRGQPRPAGARSRRSPRTACTRCVGTGARWEGHEGAARFYTELLTAFPDIHFDLEYIVIGPQGVCEEAQVTATHEGRWLEHEPTGERLEWRNAIFFPWDPAARKFKGEMVYTDLGRLRLASRSRRRRPTAARRSGGMTSRRAAPGDAPERVHDGGAELLAAAGADLQHRLVHRRAPCAYGRSVVIASQASASAMIAASSGIAVVRAGRPGSRGRPSARGGGGSPGPSPGTRRPWRRSRRRG